ncbi:MAG: hypothetical protein HKN32_08580, partial [Flavobacteriales bacterium]|nr:hypothetical protein [Flavobacteriales bacterium]
MSCAPNKIQALETEIKTNTPAFHKINIVGSTLRNGVFDPSLEYDENGTGWLSYSNVGIPQFVETRLAKSNDEGRSWTYVSTPNKSYEETLSPKKGLKVQGAWRYETSSLLYDPTDVPSKRWKLFSERYFAKKPYKKDDALHGAGWIELKTAATPEGPWSKEQCVLGNRDFCKTNINRLSPDLKNMSYYNEIGSIVVEGTIYLSLDASPTPSGLGEWDERSIIMIASSDHGNSWKYLGKLTQYEDAARLGYLALTGSSLAKQGSKYYLLLTPSGAKGLGKKKGHDGTLVVEFKDITKGIVNRNGSGELVINKVIRPTLHSGGLSDYDEANSGGGLLFSQINAK